MTLDSRTSASFGSDDAVPASQPTEPLLHQHGAEMQQFGTVRLFPIALSSDARIESCQLLNQVLANSMIPYSQYKEHHPARCRGDAYASCCG